jgi:hypothetical protein
LAGSITVDYVSGGVAQTAVLDAANGFTASASPDDGTPVTFSAASSGSNSNERWQYDANGDQPTFLASRDPSPLVAYYSDQQRLNLQAITANGTPLSASNDVTASYLQFGNALQSSGLYDGTSFSDWADVGSKVSYAVQSSGSTATNTGERWATGQQTVFNVVPQNSVELFQVSYYDQESVTAQVNTVNGTPLAVGNSVSLYWNEFNGAGALNYGIYDAFGAFPLWANVGGQVHFGSTSSGSTATNTGERWATDQQTVFNVVPQNSVELFQVSYYDQKHVTFQAKTTSGTPLSAINYVTASYAQFNNTLHSSGFYDGAPFSDWADVGSQILFDKQSSGSGPINVWQTAPGEQSSFTVGTDVSPYLVNYYALIVTNETLQTPGENLSTPAYIPLATLPPLPSPVGAVLPEVTEFTVSSVTPGGSATVVMQLPAGTLQPNTPYAYFKYNLHYNPNDPNSQAWVHTNPGVATFDVAHQTITLKLQDDGVIADGDEDAADNGDILDPGVPVILGGTTTAASSTASGLSVTLTATVTAKTPGSGTPTGMVDFFDSTTNYDLGSAPLSGGVATLNVGLLPGNQTITVTYSGDSNFAISTGTVSLSPLTSVYVLSPTGSGALTLSGNASINLPGVIDVNSSSPTAINASGSAIVTASAINVVGGVSATGSAQFNPAPTTGAKSVADPLAGLAAPPVGGAVQPAINVSGNSSPTIGPGIYGGITVSGNGKLTMSPGVYVIAGGGFSVSGNGIVTGSNVLIYNAGTKYPPAGGSFGVISITGNAQVTLSPAATGAYAGLTFFQARDNTQPMTMTASSIAVGAVYAPAAALTMSGNAHLKNALLVARLSLSITAIINNGALTTPDGAMPAAVGRANGLSVLGPGGTGQMMGLVNAFDNPAIPAALDLFENAIAPGMELYPSNTLLVSAPDAVLTTGDAGVEFGQGVWWSDFSAF